MQILLIVLQTDCHCRLRPTSPCVGAARRSATRAAGCASPVTSLGFQGPGLAAPAPGRAVLRGVTPSASAPLRVPVSPAVSPPKLPFRLFRAYGQCTLTFSPAGPSVWILILQGISGRAPCCHLAVSSDAFSETPSLTVRTGAALAPSVGSILSSLALTDPGDLFFA